MAIRHARENCIPYLGICLGMQLAVIEYARDKAGMEDAHSTEFHPDAPYPVIGLTTEWRTREGHMESRDAESDLGGTMRLGGQECLLKEDSLVRKIYGAGKVIERHRHRYEVNNKYIPRLEGSWPAHKRGIGGRRVVRDGRVAAERASVVCCLSISS